MEPDKGKKLEEKKLPGRDVIDPFYFPLPLIQRPIVERIFKVIISMPK